MKNIAKMIDEYVPDKDNDDDDIYHLKCALNALSPADKVIMVIYCEQGSLRKTGQILGVSHTIVYKQIKKIKKQMYDYLRTIYDNSNSVLLNRFERLYSVDEEIDMEMVERE